MISIRLMTKPFKLNFRISGMFEASDIFYDIHMTQADKKSTAVVLNDFQGMNQFEIKDDAI